MPDSILCGTNTVDSRTLSLKKVKQTCTLTTSCKFVLTFVMTLASKKHNLIRAEIVQLMVRQCVQQKSMLLIKFDHLAFSALKLRSTGEYIKRYYVLVTELISTHYNLVVLDLLLQ